MIRYARHRYRIWKLNRRLNHLLSNAGLPPNTTRIFSGNVSSDTRVYTTTTTDKAS